MAVNRRTKPAPDTSSKEGTAPVAGALHDSAQQIWQAGLGAFTRAQMDGSKTFEALVKEGVEIQRKTQAAAEQRMAEATQHMTSLASNFGGTAAAPWDKLSHIFEERVARALHVLGIPTAKDLAALQARVDALTKAMQQREVAPPATPVAPPTPRKNRTAGKTGA